MMASLHELLIDFYILISFVSVYLLINYLKNNQIFTNPKTSWAYNHHMKNISKCINELVESTDHVSLASVMVSMDESITYFENINMSIFDRPPSRLRASIRTYVKLVIEYIYNIDAIEVKYLNKINFVHSIQELEELSEYKDMDESQKEDIARRREEYKKKLHLDALKEKLHSGVNIINILDTQSLSIQRALNSNKRNNLI